MGKFVTKLSEGQNLQEMGKLTDIYVYEKNFVTRGLSSSAPGLYTCTVYYHNIQTSSSLKPLGQSKPNFMWSIVRKGE